MSIVNIAVMSDLHCYSLSDPQRTEKKWPEPSYLTADTRPQTLQRDPLLDLQQFINSKSLRADLLLCGGDLGDRGSPSGITQSWKLVSTIGSALQVQRIAATSGNHDLDYSHHEPAGHLKALTPLFPINDQTHRASYWTDHYAVIDDPSYRLILLNSSAFHGIGLDEENKHGRIDERTLRQLSSSLEAKPRSAVQVLLCHHHPQQHADYNLGEYDVMTYGQHLLDLLSKHGQWLVVHGHKHHPKLTHAAGGSTAPWVFAAGSVSAIFWKGTVGNCRNQFYIITIDPTTFDTLGWGGRVRAWDWAPGDGWKPAGLASGLPSDFGFGFSGDIPMLANRIQSLLPAFRKGYLQWGDLCSKLPILTRLSPRDVIELKNWGLAIGFDHEGKPTQFARLS